MTKLKHLSVKFSCFVFIVSYIGSFQGMKYVYFHVQLYHNSSISGNTVPLYISGKYKVPLDFYITLLEHLACA